MDDRLKHLVEKLGVAINDSISGSEQIPDVIAQFEGSGYHVLLSLNATIAITRREEEAVRLRSRAHGRPETGFNLEDVQFLKSMHISVNK